MNPETLAIATLLTAALLAGIFSTSPMAAYAGGHDDYDSNDNEDYIETMTGQKLKQENTGSGASTNTNCGLNTVSSEVSIECDGTANGNGRSFTIIVVANEGTIECEPPLPSGDSFIAAIAQGDGAVTGNYTITHLGTVTQQRFGQLSAATTDGNTYTLSAENLSICSDLAGEITISGDCGDDVTIRYEDPSAAGTFTGNVECTLMA